MSPMAPRLRRGRPAPLGRDAPMPATGWVLDEPPKGAAMPDPQALSPELLIVFVLTMAFLRR